MPIKPSPYVPAFMRAIVSGSKPLQLTFSSVGETNIISTSSFRYDPADAPLKSTQQLNVDWSRFENHTFFSSAESNVNMAFDQIINGYPFDGTRAEVEHFFERLTGFEKWVYDQFPKWRGQLNFSGTQVGEDVDGSLGTWIRVSDYAGALFPEISKNQTGESILNPRDGASLSIELQLYIPTTSNDAQVVCQKMSASVHGFSLHLLPSISTASCTANFTFVSGSTYVTAPAELQKGKFNHVCVVLNRDEATPYAEFYVNELRAGMSRNSYAFGELDIENVDFFIGTGSTVTTPAGTFTPAQTFSGSVDEFRLFHSVRSLDSQKRYLNKSIFATPDLKLYYRFNEPPPPLSTNSTIDAIALDSSGNSLHAMIENFTGSLRVSANDDPLNPVVYERHDTTPVLFPAHADVVTLNEELLASASAYDLENPNIITRLVPPHYLQEGAFAEGFDTEIGNAGDPYGGDGIPGQGKMGSVQLILTFLYIWAKFFDEMKLFVDSFNTLRTVDYEQTNTVPDNFLNVLVSQYGFYLPPMFNDSSLDQYIDAENVGSEISTGTYPLKYVQQQLLRRVMVNMPDVIRSKGTQHSIKSFLRAVGIDPDNSMRIREYGGPTTRQLTYSRENKCETNYMVEFSTSSLAVSPYLSASRLEVGYPKQVGTMVREDLYPPHGISNNANDGLLTSGSWTVEGIFKYAPSVSKAMATTQSLARLCVTASNDSRGGIIANLTLMSSSIDPKLVLFVRAGAEATAFSQNAPLLTLPLVMPAQGPFTGERWNFAFGRERADSVNSRVSSSYFVRLAHQDGGSITHFASTSSYFLESNATSDIAFCAKASSFNASGSYLAVGPGQTVLSGSGTTYLYLNNTSVAPDEARVTAQVGRLSNLRFWSKALSEIEWREHVRSYKSAGVVDPLTNYNFVKTASGSFERLRLDTFTKQDTRWANSTASLGPIGSITFIDFSLNGNHMTGSGFPIERNILVGELFDYSYLSPYFDEASTNEKVRIRSYQDQALVDETPWAQVAPVYEVLRSEKPTDDVRFVIEFSLVDALNRDISTIFATYDAIDNALGDPTLVFSPDYPDLERLRDMYFNRIMSKLNFKEFFEFFRWFDTSIGTFIEQLVPRKTQFKGTNFVVESHMLERHKIEYKHSDVYVNEEHRPRISDAIQLQQITGNARKY
jgi:hypothetical protein